MPCPPSSPCRPWITLALFLALLSLGLPAGGQEEPVKPSFTAGKLQQAQQRRAGKIRFEADVSPRNRLTDDQIQQALEPGQVLLVYATHPESSDQLLVQAVRSEGASEPQPIEASMPEIGSGIEQMYALMGRGDRPSRGQFLRLTDELGKQLLAPVSAELGGASQLVVHAGGALDRLPFAALRLPRSLDKRRGHLVEGYELCHLAEIADLTLPAPELFSGPTLAAADPEFRRDSRPLGASMSDAGVSWRQSAARRLEAKAVHAAFPQSSALLGSELTRSALAASEPLGLLHLATDISGGYSIASANIELSTGDPNAPPDLVPIREFTEMMSSKGGLAVVSGLQPERSEREAGQTNARNFLTSEELGEGGLGEAPMATATALAARLQRAGFHQALTTLWLTPQEVSARLFKTFYSHLASGTPAPGALRAAQLELVESPVDIGGSSRIDAREPLYWAGLRLYSNCRHEGSK